MVDIAVVYRKTDSAEYLMKSVNDINGKQLNNLDDLHYFYNHYEEMYTAVSALSHKKLDADAARVDRELAVLNGMYEDRVALRSWNIDSRIRALEGQATMAHMGGRKIKLMARVIGLKLYRNTYIHRPLRDLKGHIRQKEADKNELMTNGPALIEENYRKLLSTYTFIHNNRALLESAMREEAVINALSTLGNDYHIINHFSLGRKKDNLPAKIARRPVLPCNLAHIVVGPTGMFMIIMMPPGDPRSEESNKCMHHAINLNRNVKKFLEMNDLSEHDVKPRTVLVTSHGGYGGEYLGESVDMVSIDRLGSYLKHYNYHISNYTVDEMVLLFNR